MKTRISLCVLLLVLGLALSTVAADINGQWTATFDTPAGPQAYTYTFKADGEKLTGTAKSDNGVSDIQNGTIKGDDISFVENLDFNGMTFSLTYTGKISGDEIMFTRSISDMGYSDNAVAKRVK